MSAPRLADDEESEFAASWEEIGVELKISKQYARMIGLNAMRKMHKTCLEYGIAPYAIYSSRAGL